MPPRKKTKVADKAVDTAKSRGTKRVKTGVRPVRGRRGGLKDMPTMPLDVLLEIFKYMNPRDLLFLARTTKEFRAFLMSRTSAPYWRETLKNVADLPPCPSFLCEPTYVNLLFTTNCMGCGKSHGGTQWVIWEFFVRYCSDCRDRRIYNRYQAEKFTKTKYESHPKLKDDEDDHEVCNRILDVTARRAGISKNKSQESWSLRELDKNLEEWLVIKNTDQAPAFVKKLRKHKDDVLQAARSCSNWSYHQVTEKSAMLRAKEDTLRAKRKERIAAILQRLREEGWSDEIQHLRSRDATDFTELEIVRRPSELTEDGWAKVWEALEAKFRAAREHLEEIKTNKQMDGRFASLKAAIAEFDKSAPGAALAVRPQFYDYTAMPEIEKLAGAPLVREITKDDFLALLPALAAEWLSECKSVLQGIVRKELPSIDAATEPLDLFVASFRCSSSSRDCRYTLQKRYPAILEHGCFRNCEKKTDGKTMLAKHLKRQAGYYGPSEPLIRTITTSARVSSQGLHILAVLGKDPACTTAADLKGNYTILECADCSPTQDCVFTWKGAMAHCHRDDKNHWLPLLNEKGVNMKLQREAEAQAAADAKAVEAKAGAEANAEADAAVAA